MEKQLIRKIHAGLYMMENNMENHIENERPDGFHNIYLINYRKHVY